MLTLTRAGMLALAAAFGLLLVLALVRRQWRRLALPTALASLSGGVALGLLSVQMRNFDPRFATENDWGWYAATYDVARNAHRGPNARNRRRVTARNTGEVVWTSRWAREFRPWLPLAHRRRRCHRSTCPRRCSTCPTTCHLATPSSSRCASMRVSRPATIASPGACSSNRCCGSTIVATRTPRRWSTSPAEIHRPPTPPVGVEPRSDLTAALPPVPRTELWGAALSMVRQHPLLGVGPDNFRHIYGTYLGLPAWDDRVHANNLYLELLADMGVLGALAFAALVALPIVSLLRGLRSPDLAATGALAGRLRGQPAGVLPPRRARLFPGIHAGVPSLLASLGRRAWRRPSGRRADRRPSASCADALGVGAITPARCSVWRWAAGPRRGNRWLRAPGSFARSHRRPAADQSAAGRRARAGRAGLLTCGLLRRWPAVPRQVAWPTLIWLGLLLVSAYLAPTYQTQSLAFVRDMALCVAFGWAVYDLAVLTARQTLIAKAFAVCGMVVAALGLLEAANVQPIARLAERLPHSGKLRRRRAAAHRSTLPHPNIAAMLLGLALPLQVAWIVSVRSGRARLALGLGAAIELAALVLTVSRAGILVTALVLGLMLLIGFRQHQVRLVSASLSALVCLPLLLGLAARREPLMLLHLTSENVDGWYRADYSTPGEVCRRSPAQRPPFGPLCKIPAIEPGTPRAASLRPELSPRRCLRARPSRTTDRVRRCPATYAPGAVGRAAGAGRRTAVAGHLRDRVGRRSRRR